MKLKIRKTDPRAELPVRGTPGSAGLDLRAVLDEPMTLPPWALVSVPTGIAIGLPSPDTVGLVFARSGLAVKHGIGLSNGVWVIDSDYTGEIRVGLINQSAVPYDLHPGERIAQLVVMPICRPELVEADTLEETERGAGGFGSTGRL